MEDERLGARIVLVAQFRTEEGGTLEALQGHLARELPGFMRPAEILTRAGLPRGPNGKIDRAALVQEYGR